MKLTKLVLCTTVSALLLGDCVAKANVGVTTNAGKLDITFIVITNGPSVTVSNLTKYRVGKAKLGNNQLLDLFAHWDGSDRTVNPWKTAKLVIGWDWGGDVLVVDKTGTNVLFDANAAEDHYFYVDVNDYDGAYVEDYKDALPGYDKWTEWRGVDFALYDDDYYLPYTYLWADGGSTQDFKQSWDASGNYTTWSDVESLDFLYEGGQSFLDSSTSETTVSGSINIDGRGRGLNSYWYGD